MTAALFHSYVQRPKISAELSFEARDKILAQYEKEGYLYDWQSFETRLLEATRTGILGAYIRSIGIWISIILALFFVFVPFWYFPQISIVMLLITMILYLSLLSQTWEYEKNEILRLKEWGT